MYDSFYYIGSISCAADGFLFLEKQTTLARYEGFSIDKSLKYKSMRKEWFIPCLLLLLLSISRSEVMEAKAFLDGDAQ